MAETELIPDDHRFVDLPALARAGLVPGPAWTHQGNDLNVNLLVFAAGDGVPTHVNTEVDVLIVGIEGTGILEIDGQPQTCSAGKVLIIPKGVSRSTLATSDHFAYLTCHRRRAGLWPTVRPKPAQPEPEPTS